jgi:hypothetical protein
MNTPAKSIHVLKFIITINIKHIILNPERLSIENVNCWSVCPVSHWFKKLTNQILVLIKLANQV